MGNTCTPVADSCQCMAKPLQYCEVISLQLNILKMKLSKLKKEKNKKPFFFIEHKCPRS